MQALLRLSNDFHFHVFTKVPEWLITESVNSNHITYHFMDTDLGLIQKNPFEEDELATIVELQRRIPFEKHNYDTLCNELDRLKLDIILCDIAPIGIYSGKQIGIPTVLVENFTWDWIYEGYTQIAKQANQEIEYLRNLFQQATVHIQTEPVCFRSAENGSSNLYTVPPVSRFHEASREEFRSNLSIDSKKPLLTISMGGIQGGSIPFKRLKEYKDYSFVIPDLTLAKTRSDKNLYFLGRDAKIYHPDLMAASDIVIGKMGYGTFAETYSSGVPYYYITRSKFRESKIMDAFAKEHTQSLSMTEDDFISIDWMKNIPQLLSSPRSSSVENGAIQVSEIIINAMKDSSN